MRLKADIWVKAYMRRCALEGAAAMLERRGDEDAGAIYIKIVRLDGTACLYVRPLRVSPKSAKTAASYP